jgi:hypothetical protein
MKKKSTYILGTEKFRVNFDRQEQRAKDRFCGLPVFQQLNCKLRSGKGGTKA